MCEGCSADSYASSSEEKGNVFNEHDDDIVIPVRDHGQVLLTRASVKPCELEHVVTDQFWKMLSGDVEDLLCRLFANRRLMRWLIIAFVVLVIVAAESQQYIMAAQNCVIVMFCIYHTEVSLLYNMRVVLRILLHTINVYCSNSVSGYVLLLKTTGGCCMCNSQNSIIIRKTSLCNYAELSLPNKIVTKSRQVKETYAQLDDQFMVTLPKFYSTSRIATWYSSNDNVDDQYFLDKHTVPPGISAEAWLIFCNDTEAMLAASTKALPWLLFGTITSFTILAVAGQVPDRSTVAITAGACACCCCIWLVFLRSVIQLSMEKKFERIKTYGNTLFSGHIVTFEPAPVCTALCLSDSILFKKDSHVEMHHHV